MEFKHAFKLMKDGIKVKLPSWAGFWAWENGTIMMHCKDGKVIDIRETEVPDYTFTNVGSDEWTIADETNTPVLGGEALFGFGEAIKYLKRGLKVVRKGWNGKGMWIELQTPDEHSKMTRPYLYINCPKGSTNHFGSSAKDIDRVPWLVSQTDILAEDWVIVD
jgi:hypothetical protein